MRLSKGVVAYLVLSFGLAWGLWEAAFRLGLSPADPLFQLAILPGAFAPAVAALIVRAGVTREGFGDAGLRPNLRRTWRYYLLGWLYPLLGVAVLAALALGLGIARPDLSLQRAATALLGEAAQPIPDLLVLLLPAQLLLNALLATPLLWGEEFGWRGYLQLRLYPGKPLRAAAATGVIWGLWHLPINLRGYNFAGQPLAGMMVFTVSTVLLSIIFGWLQQRTGSVWAPSLAHAATNAVGGSLTLLLFYGSGYPLMIAYVGILGWVPLGALAAWIAWRGYPRSVRVEG
ncbi:MAG: CPBP family intramembrane metalloprotease [Anaerolineales bacterium]|nr:CPBP family intramembrane metalloprotease [Anaerolineales bacterium]